MMLECELLARAAFMHHEDQGHDAIRHDAVLTGLSGSAARPNAGRFIWGSL